MSLRRDLNIAPTPTLPAGGEGVADPPPFTGEVGRGACRKTNAKTLIIPIARSEFTIAPPSLRFPPLREGNQAARLFGSPCGQGEPYGADKGTSVRHRIDAARAIFPSASVNGWARLFALTPFVPPDKGTSVGYKKSAAWGKFHPL